MGLTFQTSTQHAHNVLTFLQGPQTFTLFVTAEPGQEASEEAASGEEYPVLAPEDAAALTAELNQAFAGALAPAAGQQSPELFELRIEVRPLNCGEQGLYLYSSGPCSLKNLDCPFPLKFCQAACT